MHTTILHGANLFLTYLEYNIVLKDGTSCILQCTADQIDACTYPVIMYIPVIPCKAGDQMCEFVHVWNVHSTLQAGQPFIALGPKDIYFCTVSVA